MGEVRSMCRKMHTHAAILSSRGSARGSGRGLCRLNDGGVALLLNQLLDPFILGRII